MPFTDDDLKRLKELYTNAQASGWSVIEEMEFNDFFEKHLDALLARLEAAEDCIEATRRWLVNQGPQMDIDLTMISWRQKAGK